MKIHDMEQGSDEWLRIRMGKVTASNFATAMAKGKAGGVSKTRTTLMHKLIAERLTNEPQETYRNGAMEWGTETEPAAREYYEAVNDCDVRQIGFAEHNDYIGCSPDGLVGEDGLLEIKCPNSATHISYILADKLPSTYKAQVQGQLWVTERKWCDFVSYDPRVTKRPYWTIRVSRDQPYIDLLECAVGDMACDIRMILNQLTESQF
jgi:putative phage-type endonuclease